MTIRVLVVDDQALLRTAFSSLIDAEDDLEVVGEAAEGRQAVELAASLAPDVGFALKSRPLEELLSAIRTVAAGEALLAPSVTRRLIAHFAEGARVPRRTPRGLDELTDREREVLSLVA